MLREDGGPNTAFLYYLFCDEPMAIQFLQEVGFFYLQHAPLQIVILHA